MAVRGRFRFVAALRQRGAVRFGGAVVALTLLAGATACGASADTPTGPASPQASPGTASSPVDRTGVAHTDRIMLGNRPFSLHVPASYRTGTAAPLVVLLHGYSASGAQQESYLKLTAESDRRGFLYAIPDGTTDSRGKRFWNATDACCDLYGSTVDDSAYISRLITTVGAKFTVDTRRVYLVGHSNGAFMAFRMACDHADQITAIATLNGAMWSDVSRCRPSRPVSVLDIRGTADDTIAYAGASLVDHPYPSARTTDADWVAFDHCAATASSAPALDLVTDLAGKETTVASYGACAGQSTVQTWTIHGGPHIPAFGPAFAPAMLDVLLARVAP